MSILSIINKIVEDQPMMNPSIDMLVQKPQMYVYIRKEFEPYMDNEVMCPRLLAKKNPKLNDIIFNMFNDDFLDGTVAFPCRVPELPQTEEFLSNHTPFKLQTLKLKKSKGNKYIYIGKNIKEFGDDFQFNLPDLERILPLHNFWQDKFKECNDPMLRDAPCIIIKQSTGSIPQFQIKKIN